ncbi:MAG: ribosomal RNA small subunit methyltransferase A [bacterium]|nr:ribosomal RNA small subunit methyltransferase A [bacterium]
MTKPGKAPKIGQVFLTDSDYTRRIADAADIGPEDTVLEIGPGQGHLTQFLVRRAKEVISVELDERLVARLADTFDGHENLTVVQGNILDLDFDYIMEDSRPAICVANIPYYITGPILDFLFEHRADLPRWSLLMQKEVARRLCALPGGREYGRLSVRARYYGTPEFEFEVPRTAFEPPPKVDSALVTFRYYDESPLPETKDELQLFYLVDYLFGSRRKKIRKRLLSFLGGRMTGEELDALLDELDISGDARPEDLSIEEYIRLGNGLVE